MTFKVTFMITPGLYKVCINIPGSCMHIDIYQVSTQKKNSTYIATQ